MDPRPAPSRAPSAERSEPEERRDANGNVVVVIDGHALAFRSYYAIRELSTSTGRSVNAVFGFLRSLLRILDEEGEHDATVVTFDAPAKTFRHEAYEDYKAGRAATPDDLPEQIRTIKRLVDLLGLHRVEVPGLEADDLIGTIAKRSEALGYHVEIVTSDRDAYQLVSDRVCVRGLDKTDRYGPEDVLAKYGVTVEQWVDYRALTGDASDNIPGARGIGPKSAQKLLQSYGSLDWILEHLDEVEPASYRKKIEASLEDVRFSRELSRIVTDADIEIEPASWAKREMRRAELAEELRGLEFGTMLRALRLESGPSWDEAAWDELEPGTAAAVGFALDDARAMEAGLDGLALAVDGRVAAAPDGDAARAALAALDRIDACDAKALAVWARREGMELEPGDDPLLMAYVLDPNAAAPETAARRWGAGEWDESPASRAAVAAELLARLPGQMTPEQRSLYEEIERPLQRVLVDMEVCGVRVDEAPLLAQSAALGERIETLQDEVRTLAGRPDMNLNSRDQVAELLYDDLGLQAGRKTATGKRSTAVAVLEGLAREHEVVRKILDYRELTKLKSTYLDPLPRMIRPETGRIHTTFNQTGTATGRLSSVNPNLQNIPVRTELGREIRRAFIADEGSVLLAADYSQIELRVLAHVTGDEALITAFREGADVHRRVAAAIYGVAPEDVEPDMRRAAKTINFGVLYGMSAHRLTRELGIGFDEAEAFIERYFEGYPGVRAYIDRTLESCRERGWVETVLGRRRMIPDIASRNRNAREYAERTAYNQPIQGTAADIMKIAMVRLAPAVAAHDARLTLQVHDEIVVEAPEAEAEAAARTVREVMEGAFDLAVPLVAEVGIGRNWLEAK